MFECVWSFCGVGAERVNLSKSVSFLQLFPDISKKSKAVIAIYVYASESSCFALLENGVGSYAMT